MTSYTTIDYTLVKGSATRSVKDDLKSMGGVWSGQLGGWFVPSEVFSQVEDLLASAPPPTERERGATDRVANFKAAVEEAGGYDIDYMNILSYTDKSFVVYGATKDFKDELRSLHGSWNRALLGWVFSNKRLSEVEEFVDLTNSNME